MRTILLFGFIILSKSIFAQPIPKFALTKDGVQPISITIDSLNARELHKKTVNWISDYFKNPDEVNKIELESDKILIHGFKKNAWKYHGLDTTISYDVEYLLHVDFEDHKILMSIEFDKTWDQSSGKGVQSYDLNYTKIWKKDGELHKVYKDTKNGIDEMMNEFSNSLVNYMKEFHYTSEDNVSKNPLLKLWQKIRFKETY